MKPFHKEKPLYRKVCWLISDLKMLGIVFPLLFFLWIGTYLSNHTSLGIVASSCLGFLIGFIFTFFTLPAWFVKPTSQPSSFQRFCRNYFLGIVKFVSFVGLGSHSGEYIYTKDIRFFQYYLSHPEKPESVWADQVDTTQFDWQNPAEWKNNLIGLQSRKKDGKERKT